VPDADTEGRTGGSAGSEYDDESGHGRVDEVDGGKLTKAKCKASEESRRSQGQFMVVMIVVVGGSE